MVKHPLLYKRQRLRLRPRVQSSLDRHSMRVTRMTGAATLALRGLPKASTKRSPSKERTTAIDNVTDRQHLIDAPFRRKEQAKGGQGGGEPRLNARSVARQIWRSLAAVFI